MCVYEYIIIPTADIKSNSKEKNESKLKFEEWRGERKNNGKGGRMFELNATKVESLTVKVS